MEKDITDLSDIKLLVNSFYAKVQSDELIGYLFNDVAKVNWEAHLPVMYSFWEQVIFNTGGFKGNPIQAHQRLHQLSPLRKEHFQRWLELFFHTLEELFAGPNTELTRQRAQSIATVLEIKLLHGGIHPPVS